MVDNPLMGRHLLSSRSWSREELDALIKTAKNFKKMFHAGIPHRSLQGQTVFNIFFDQYSQTLTSMSTAITQLGGHAHNLSPHSLMLLHGETPRDTAQVLSRLGQAIACRNCRYGSGHRYIRELSRWSSVPVINLQCDQHHPVQAISDLMTLQEAFSDSLRGLKAVISWAYTKGPVKPLSVPQSQVLLFTRYGIDVTVAAPPEFPLSAGIVDQAKSFAKSNETKLAFTNDMDAAFEGAHIVVAKNWGGFALFDDFKDDRDHHEAMSASLKKHQAWRCTPERMALADRDARFLHAMPVDRGWEADDAVVDSKASIIYEAAENRLHILKALMVLCMSDAG